MSSHLPAVMLWLASSLQAHCQQEVSSTQLSHQHTAGWIWNTDKDGHTFTNTHIYNMHATAYQMFSLLGIFCKHRQIEDMWMLPRAYTCFLLCRFSHWLLVSVHVMQTHNKTLSKTVSVCQLTWQEQRAIFHPIFALSSCIHPETRSLPWLLNSTQGDIHPLKRAAD